MSNGLQQINDPQPDFLNLISARHGHFKLESGHHGNLWLNLERLFLHPKVIQPFILELAHKLSPYNLDAICGPMIGGALIAHNIALKLGADFFYTERVAPQTPDGLFSVSYKLPRLNHSSISGKNIAIVDDVINAGSAVHGTMLELQSLGANVVAIGALLVLGETGKKYFAERNLEIEGIAQLKNEIWTPKECPLCSTQIPLDTID